MVHVYMPSQSVQSSVHVPSGGTHTARLTMLWLLRCSVSDV